MPRKVSKNVKSKPKKGKESETEEEDEAPLLRRLRSKRQQNVI